MPRRTIFVRDDDLDAFEAIIDRPGWLHDAIQFAKDLAEIKSKGSIKRGNIVISHAEKEDPTTYISEDEMP